MSKGRRTLPASGFVERMLLSLATISLSRYRLQQGAGYPAAVRVRYAGGTIEISNSTIDVSSEGEGGIFELLAAGKGQSVITSIGNTIITSGKDRLAEGVDV